MVRNASDSGGSISSFQMSRRLQCKSPRRPRYCPAQLVAGIHLFVLPLCQHGQRRRRHPVLLSSPRLSATGSTMVLLLGLDIWDGIRTPNMDLLTAGCGCYACARHHHAYVRRLARRSRDANADTAAGAQPQRGGTLLCGHEETFGK